MISKPCWFDVFHLFLQYRNPLYTINDCESDRYIPVEILLGELLCLIKLIQAVWRIGAPLNYARIISNNGLVHLQIQANVLTICFNWFNPLKQTICLFDLTLWNRLWWIFLSIYKDSYSIESIKIAAQLILKPNHAPMCCVSDRVANQTPSG